METLFEDTFTGSGSLDSHTSDTGQAWSIDSGGMTLSGGQVLAARTSSTRCQGQAFSEISASLSEAFDVTMETVWQHNTAGNAPAYTFRATIGGVSLEVTSVATWPTATYTLGNDEETLTGSLGWTPSVGVHAIRFSYDSGVMSMYVDDTLMATEAITPSAPSATDLSFSYNVQGNGANAPNDPTPVLTRLLVEGTPDTPPVVDPFWTGLVGCSQA